jgi:hypothetical protein
VLLSDLFVSEYMDVSALQANPIFRVQYFPCHNRYDLEGTSMRPFFQGYTSQGSEDTSLMGRPAREGLGVDQVDLQVGGQPAPSLAAEGQPASSLAAEGQPGPG